MSTIVIPVDVAWKHIRKGKRWSHCECPVALAVKESLPKEYNGARVVVTAGRIMIGFSETKPPVHEIFNSDEVAMFIHSFDNNNYDYYKPFKFSIALKKINPIVLWWKRMRK
jgi:hypothetical protein